MSWRPTRIQRSVSEALLRPVRLGNAFEDTVARLLQTIRLGMLAPGESLPPERELAARLGVSRDTVREAIKSLAEAGYLVSRAGATAARSWPTSCPRRSTGDTRLSRDEIDDVLRLREILEVGAARMAASRTLTAAERELLWTRLTDVRGAALDDYRRLDSRLHLAIAEAAGVAVAGAAGRREPHAAQRTARSHPAAVAQHRALRRTARGDRGGDPGRGL